MVGQRHGSTRPIDQLTLFAPDVGLNHFHDGDRPPWPAVAGFRSTRASTTRHSSRRSLHAEQRVGDAFPPVLLDGIETIDCSAIDATSFRHGYYGSNIDVLADLFMLSERDRTASQRSHLQPKATPDGDVLALDCHGSA